MLKIWEFTGRVDLTLQVLLLHSLQFPLFVHLVGLPAIHQEGILLGSGFLKVIKANHHGRDIVQGLGVHAIVQDLVYHEPCFLMQSGRPAGL